VSDHQQQTRRRVTAGLAIAFSTVLGVVILVYPGPAARAELPNRIPEAVHTWAWASEGDTRQPSWTLLFATPLSPRGQIHRPAPARSMDDRV
jgi:hypothetical protein